MSSTPDPRPLVRRQFGAHAQNYVTSPDHAKSDSLDRLVAVLQPQPHWRVLDVATGGGHTALALAPHVREVVATDLTTEMLAAAERHIVGQGVANVSFREADATALPFGDAEFDLVTCRIAPHHFPDCAAFVREKLRGIAEVRAVVRRELAALGDICEVPPVDGAFYFLLRARSDRPALEIAERLIREHRVAVIPGNAFGLDRGCHLRVAYGALQKETAAEGVARLVRGLKALLR